MGSNWTKTVPLSPSLTQDTPNGDPRSNFSHLIPARAGQLPPGPGTRDSGNYPRPCRPSSMGNAGWDRHIAVKSNSDTMHRVFVDGGGVVMQSEELPKIRLDCLAPPNQVSRFSIFRRHLQSCRLPVETVRQGSSPTPPTILSSG
jgi:hypothetical protein